MSWTKTIERYLREGRTVSGGCGPSAAMKSINQNIQAFAGQVQTEAGAVFGAASSVFNNIMNATKGIISGGPSQYGYSAGEQSALTAQAVNAGATEARNLKGAAASEVGAIGGGNTVTPAGIQQATVMSAEQKAAADTAAAENQIETQGYEVGRENYNTALGAEEKAPDVFNASTEANKGVVQAQTAAATSQQNIDTTSNWAMNDVMKLGTAAVQGAAGGLTGGVGSFGSLFKGGGPGVTLPDTAGGSAYGS